MARTLLLGKPDQLKIDTMNKTIEALEAGINATKPGNTADDVAQAFWGILDKYGITTAQLTARLRHPPRPISERVAGERQAESEN